MLIVATFLAFVVGLSNFVNGLAFSFDATFHLVLSQLINPAGISVVTNFSQLPQSYFGLTISPNSDPQDYTVYALNATNAECSYKYEVKTSSGLDYHSSGTCLSDAQAGSTASFLVDCTVDANAENQANFILVSFQDGFATFQAFGDATASFQSGIPFFVGLNGLTVSSTSTGASIDFGSSIVWTQQNSSYQANPCVLVNCPASASPSS